MKQLIRYELSKLCFRRAILFAILVFSILDLMKIQDVYQSYSYLTNGSGEQSWNTVYWELYPRFLGKVTADKTQELMALYRPLDEKTADLTASTAMDNPDTMTGNVYSDRNLLDKYYVRPMKYFFTYQNTASQIAEQARENSSLYQAAGNVFEVRKNAIIYHMFAQREISEFAYTEMYNYLVNYDFSIALILLLCLYGVPTVFVREKETQMHLLLVTSPNGGFQTCAAKIIAVSVFATGITLWFSLLDFIGFSTAFHSMEGGILPVYAISNFVTAAVDVTLLQYVVLSAAMKALGLWTICMVMLLISMRWKTALIPFTINLSILLGLIFTGASCQFYTNAWSKVWNPYMLLSSRTLLGKTEFIDLFGYPILSYQAAIAISAIAGILCAAAIFLFYRRNQHHYAGGFHHAEFSL